jgi:predicted dehydrogenase
LRIGVLGAARIAPAAIVRPAREVPGVEVLAIAARDEARARRFAARHGVPRVHRTYDALLADPDVDAIYNPLPNALHCAWTLRALDAGKHVLCEKPFAANEAEARRMRARADETGLVLAEAFHWRYHPLAARMREVVDSGVLGRIVHLEAAFCGPLLRPRDVRYRLDLAGGATMDTGCYPISILRFLAGAEPVVLAAEARTVPTGVDRWMRADLAFPGGATGRITCALLSREVLRISAHVRGEHGVLEVLNPVIPHVWNRLRVRTAAGVRAERVAGEATYTAQLRAFVAWVRGGPPMPTDAAHGVANMRVIDAIYRAAGLPRA